MTRFDMILKNASFMFVVLALGLASGEYSSLAGSPQNQGVEATDNVLEQASYNVPICFHHDEFQEAFSNNDDVWSRLTEGQFGLSSENGHFRLQQMGDLAIHSSSSKDAEILLRRDTLNMALNLVSQKELGVHHTQSRTSQIYGFYRGREKDPGDDPAGYIGYSTVYAEYSENENGETEKVAKVCKPENHHQFTPSERCSSGAYVRAATLYDEDMKPKKAVVQIHGADGKNDVIEANSLHAGIEDDGSLLDQLKKRYDHKKEAYQNPFTRELVLKRSRPASFAYPSSEPDCGEDATKRSTFDCHNAFWGKEARRYTRSMAPERRKELFTAIDRAHYGGTTPTRIGPLRKRTEPTSPFRCLFRVLTSNA